MPDDLFSVEDQIVLVSGGSRGIGRAIAEGFAQRKSKVVITSRERETIEATAKEISTVESRVTPLVCDVADMKAIQATVEQVMVEFGRIDTLINVAGVNIRKPALEFSEEEYDFIVDVNLKGAFFMSQAVGKKMIAQGSGSQINIASLNTDRPVKNVLPYAVSKAGMGHMTRALSMEWSPLGVRVNALAPGFILTDLTKKLWSDETMHAWGKANTPQRRLGLPEDMVGTAIFLASRASAFMTGQTLFVDGGFTAGWNWPIPE